MAPNKAQPQPRMRIENTLELQRFFMVRSDISRILRTNPEDPNLYELLDELRLMANMTDWPPLRRVAMAAVMSPELAAVMAILYEMKQCGF